MHIPPIKSWLKLSLSLGLIGLMALVLGFYYISTILRKPMFSNGPAIVIEVKPNSTANDLVEVLFAKKLISSKRLLLNMIKLEGLASGLKAGIYQIKPGETSRAFLYRVVAGDVLHLSFSIIEGTRFLQISANLKNAPYLQYSETDWSHIQKNYASAEGLLLADTYDYPAGSAATNLLKIANKNLEDFLNQTWKNRDKNLPYHHAYELLIAASILEKETAIPAERRLISGVISNRIKKRMPLQMDPTVVYALGSSYAGKLSHAHLNLDSPYNTYRHQGLPPTPIAMVGKAAIDAAAHPLPSDYLYFVAKGDGSHAFSRTYSEQKAAISRYLLNKGH